MIEQNESRGALFVKFQLSDSPGILAAEREDLVDFQKTLVELFQQPKYRVIGEYDGDEWDAKIGVYTLYFYGDADRIQRILEALVSESPFEGRITFIKHHGESRDNAIVTKA